MRYSIVIHRAALKAYKKLSRDVQNKVDDAVERLKEDPWRSDLDIKKLHGPYSGYWRLRVGDIRILYTVDREDAVIRIDALSRRAEAYR